MSYNTFNKKLASSTVLTGVRHGDKKKYKKSKEVLLTGNYTINGIQTGFIYKGNCESSDQGIFYPIKFPNSYGTFPYGPEYLSNKLVNIVGNYTLSNGQAIGFLYTGPYENTNLGIWISIIPPFEFAYNTIMHSVMNGIAVGNYGKDLSVVKSSPLKSRIYAVLYDSKQNQYQKITVPDELNLCVKSISAYGIWYNDGGNYTICGGYLTDTGNYAYMVDWNENTRKFTNFSSFMFNNKSTSVITHFDGITGLGNNVFNLTGDYLSTQKNINSEELPNELGAFFCTVNRTNNKSKWTIVNYPESLITSGNTVIDNKVYGIYIKNKKVNGYVYSHSK